MPIASPIPQRSRWQCRFWERSPSSLLGCPSDNKAFCFEPSDSETGTLPIRCEIWIWGFSNTRKWWSRNSSPGLLALTPSSSATHLSCLLLELAVMYFLSLRKVPFILLMLWTLKCTWFDSHYASPAFFTAHVYACIVASKSQPSTGLGVPVNSPQLGFGFYPSPRQSPTWPK